jgi:hypothetical protein
MDRQGRGTRSQGCTSEEQSHHSPTLEVAVVEWGRWKASPSRKPLLGGYGGDRE